MIKLIILIFILLFNSISYAETLLTYWGKHNNQEYVNEGSITYNKITNIVTDRYGYNYYPDKVPESVKADLMQIGYNFVLVNGETKIVKKGK